MRLQWGCGRCWNLPVIGSVACVGKAERGEGRGRDGVPLYVPYPDADPFNPVVLELGEQCQALFRRITRCHRSEAGAPTSSLADRCVDADGDVGVPALDHGQFSACPNSSPNPSSSTR
jgi:hypothetical protein